MSDTIEVGGGGYVTVFAGFKGTVGLEVHAPPFRGAPLDLCQLATIFMTQAEASQLAKELLDRVTE